MMKSYNLYRMVIASLLCVVVFSSNVAANSNWEISAQELYSAISKLKTERGEKAIEMVANNDPARQLSPSAPIAGSTSAMINGVTFNESAMKLATDSYNSAREFLDLSIKALDMAKERLDAGDIDSARKYIDKSNSYDRASNVAKESIEPLLASAYEIGRQQIIAKACTDISGILASVVLGPVVSLPYGAAVSTVTLFSEYQIEKNLAGQDKASKDLQLNILIEAAFTALSVATSGLPQAIDKNGFKIALQESLESAIKARGIKGLALPIAKEIATKIAEDFAKQVIFNYLQGLGASVPLPNTSTANSTPTMIIGDSGGSNGSSGNDVGLGNQSTDSNQQSFYDWIHIPPNLPPTGNTASTNNGGSPTGNSPSTTSFKFASNVDASGYSNSMAGSLMAAGTAATGISPQYVAVDPTGRFAYVTNGTGNTISVYTINQTTGALTAGTAVATGTYPQGIAVDPTGRFAYTVNNNSNTISVYTINQTTGALTAGTAVATESNPHSVAVDPTGRFAYAANYNSNTISVYIINQTTGALTAGTAVATGTEPSSVAVDPTGRFAYVSSITSRTVSVYSINQTTGALTAGTAVATEVWPLSVAVDPTGRFAYATNYGSSSISVYTINQTTGALTPVGTTATNNPYFVSFDPTGKFAYVTNGNPSPAAISTYSINQTTGALTLVGTIAATALYPQSIVVDPTGRYVYVTHEGANTVSTYAIGSLMQASNSSLTGSISGTASSGGVTAVTMTGSYDPASPSSFVWGQTIHSYNSSTGQNVTSDTPPNAYVGYLTGYKADDNTMKAKWASIYVKDNGSAGIHLGTLTGTSAAPNYTMSGTINAPVEMVSGGVGFTPANLYPAHVTTTSLVNGTPILAGGNFSGGGTMSPSYDKWESLGITGQDWGVWSSVNGGTYTGPVSSGWSLSKDYNYAATKTITGAEVKGTSWAGNKLEGTKAGYGADMNTGKTWVSIGDVIGTYDPSALTYQAVASGAWIETNKFLWMAANEPSKLQALNIPCVQVGNVNLAGSNNYGTGTMNVTMNNMKFFSNTAGGPAKIWAAGQSQMGSWIGAAPPAGTAANIAGGGLSATFTVKTFDTTTTNKFNAAITNGTGGFNGSTTFRGAAAGTINTGAKTFSGTAAGVAK